MSTCFWTAAGQVLLRREAFVFRDSTQLVVVTTPDWNSVSGMLQRYERIRPSGTWRPVGHPIGVVVGKNGLGWEAGTEAVDPGNAKSPNDPVKKEGDLRSPAGVFPLGSAFGYAAQEPAGWRMPYLHLTPSSECVDDPASKYYNQLLDRTAVSPDWKSAEQMLRSDGLYQWGLLVEQNVNPVRPGDGSCIFLHVWPGPGQATVGCTATAQEQIKVLLGWLDPDQNPLLVQLPAAKYAALEKAWGLPVIPPAARPGA